MKSREFSLYDIEQFLKEAGAERINEHALISFEEELEKFATELAGEASVYANYAGRRRLITHSDVELIGTDRHARSGRLMPLSKTRKVRRQSAATRERKRAQNMMAVL